MRLKDKVALITGAARGIGLGFAEAYAREGAKVVIADIDIDRAEEAARSIGTSVKAVKLDVTDLRQIDDVVAKIDADYGGIDILVNNAAIFDMAPVNELTEDSYERVLGINLKGPLFMMKAVSNVMIKRGRGGKIINMASQAGRRGEALVTLYCASKAAIISATQSAALALVKYGINVNAIAPGVVDGEHWDVVDANFAKWEGLKPGEKKAAVAKSVPIGRFATPEDITGMAVFLASSDSDYILAQTFGVDGGNWMA
ncbi:NAD(P)-dependent dehydrogenase (short-subunit alcohol dehydrogenase family) [Ochrobactrum intermedium]|uniref:NAD(P)-dependent dehydrogenase (Short-subunit alcohol dehydrogenase family) n=1 Tax=Brucella intermedia TaxID=94625 RepID=A0ABR6ANP1_9HYPH|nr:L-iditol 2-dehydrogenase [Brucella intermedia]HCH72448.1 L-iditol 2-dehydrogenase [Ochrobactrum sp.]KAB2709819.1 L-iditol 2-dehydrogenase [Brucella intermedia]KAB2716770.1 L-iditol 2-dehydrogenase [Brucella intermedia]MBA8851078.1 NAD(P)-dependent dehydrogenase (short-subunit alcohol dehydrogenase family) [Brucella intermedia]NYD83595.1 NAD(P)-dependent dehydrogenase (short-subunit alcohol dehydrogenase family) [Brucella intermedia]